ncbi:MAG: phospholipase A [bacterium]
MTTKQKFIRNCYLILLIFLPTIILAAEPEQRSNQENQKGSIIGEWLPREDIQATALTVNEPTYFIIGSNDGNIKARFQLSFKYRIFDEDSFPVKKVGWLKNMKFAYTQTSLWDLSADSMPFEDSSYRPSLFWEYLNPQPGTMPNLFRIGYEHESNGRGGDSSRSIDTFFILPAWGIPIGDKNLSVGTKLYVYLSQGAQNEDIEDYRGYADLILRYGTEDSWLVMAMWRHGTKNKNTVQLDLSYPIRKKFFARTGGYFYIQTFYGYGESFLTYNQKQDVNVRLGFAIVR